MEQKAPNGYDYGRVREKMLRSWGKRQEQPLKKKKRQRKQIILKRKSLK